MKRLSAAVPSFAAIFFIAILVPSGAAAPEECSQTPASRCFGVESVGTALSTTEAGAHPDLELDVTIKQDPTSKANSFGLKDSFGPTRNIRFEVPPGLIGNPNVLGDSGQCRVTELVNYQTEGCPIASQVGLSRIFGYELNNPFLEPVYMMQPPGGDVVARLGTIAGIYPTFIDFRVRSDSDYGLTAEVTEAPAAASLVKLETTFWGVPSDPIHDTERCTAKEAFDGCVSSLPRKPGILPLPFLTNPTRCGVEQTITVRASSWVEPERLEETSNEAQTVFPAFSECNRLPFGPALTVEPTNHRTSSPTGLDMTIQLPAAPGVKVLEPAQTRDIRIDLPRGLGINPGSADGLATCSPEQVHFKENVASECPDAAKMASTEFEVGALPRRLEGAIYLREPEPGNLFRIWIVADDQGAHVKLPGQLDVNKATGQIKSVVLENPQVPLREVKLLFKSGFRAPLITPRSCGEYLTHYEFTSWAGGFPWIQDTPMQINEGCGGGGFAPQLMAGSTESQGGAFSPFVFTLSRGDSEQNLSSFGITLPQGLAASFAGISRCEGEAAQTGACPPASRIGRTTVAVGVGPRPLWVPQPGKRPTAIYLGGPYKGAPFSIVAVVPAQAGPFDLGDEVIRSPVHIDPDTAQAEAQTDPLPQFKEGIPLPYKEVDVELDRRGFSLNPTSCAAKQTRAESTSIEGQKAQSSSRYRVTGCAKLPFEPKFAVRLVGGTRRGAHPKLQATLKMPKGGANIAAAQVALPHSEFVENAHFKTICTRVQFAAHACPAGSIYGYAEARTPLFDEPLSGPVYLRSSSHPLPDLVMALKGPPSLPIEIDVDGRVDSVNGGLRTTFAQIPDAPVSSFSLKMQGGKKGLIVNSTNLCQGSHRADVSFDAQNGKRKVLHPALQASCGKSSKRK